MNEQHESIEQTLDRQDARITALEAELDMLRPVAECASDWIDAVRCAYHVPTKKQYLQDRLKRLYEAVDEYDVWEKGA